MIKTEYVTREEFEMVTMKQSKSFKDRLDERLAEFVSLLRTDIENQSIRFTTEMQRQMQLQRLWYEEHMEKRIKEIVDRVLEEALTKQRLQFNEDMARHIGALTEEYQWRISAVGEKVDLIWEKCERKYAEIEVRISSHEEKLEWLGEFLPKNSKLLRTKRSNNGLAQKGKEKNRDRT